MIHAQFIFAKNIALLIQFIFASGYLCTTGEAFRTQEQAIWDSAHHTGIVASLHCERLAMDLNLFNSQGRYLDDKKDYEVIGKYWESLNSKNRAGVFWKHHPDADHFEMLPL